MVDTGGWQVIPFFLDQVVTTACRARIMIKSHQHSIHTEKSTAIAVRLPEKFSEDNKRGRLVIEQALAAD